MPRRCTVCVHEKRKAIDRAIVGGGTNRAIASQFAISKDAVDRHAKSHISKAIAKAQEVREVAHGGGLIAEITSIRDKAAELGAQAEEKGDIRTALTSVRELVRCTELIARLGLEARAGNATDISRHPIFIELQADLLAATRPCERCSAAIARKMRQRLGMPIDVDVEPDAHDGRGIAP
jgi:hypothetical protein